MAKQTKNPLYDIKPTSFETNPLFYTMVEFYNDNKNNINPATGEKARINILNEGGSRCFSKEQKILCVGGSKPISEINIGDKVYSHDHERNINVLRTVTNKKVTANEGKKCLKIRLKNGYEINCTEDHEIFHNGRYIIAKDLLSLYNKFKNKDI